MHLKHLPQSLIAAALAFVPLSPVNAQQFPERPITIIIPAAPGGQDLQMRSIGPILSKELGQPILVENRPGAGGIIGTTAVKNAKPDGHVLLYTGTAVICVVPHISTAPYTLADFAPVANVSGTPLAVVAGMNAPFSTFAGLVVYARANPGQIRFGSGGTGTTTHIIGEQLQMIADLDFNHIPYSGAGPLIPAMVGDVVHMGIALPGLFAPMVDAGRLRYVAILSDKRRPGLPNVPTAREAGVDLIEITKFGVLAPAGTPKAIVEKLSRAFKVAMASPEAVALMSKSGVDIMYMDADQFSDALKAEKARYDRLFANAKFSERVKK